LVGDVNDDFFGNVDRLRAPLEQSAKPSKGAEKGIKVSPKSKRIDGEFLKGPIPLVWLSTASRLRSKAALTVGLALWFEAGRRRNREVRLTTAICERFNVDRKAKYRGLSALEKAGLIEVKRVPRRNPIVTIKDSQTQICDGVDAPHGAGPNAD
jgi:hypothetical protein